jgi:pimeloyl-ACP methyl ester carboxylesterase
LDKEEQMKKVEYLIISDLNGWNSIDLPDSNGVKKLDARDLGRIDLEKDIHQQFVSGGIDRAASVILSYSANTVIGLSVGGVIAWRAMQKGWDVKELIAISSTRLRFEKDKPPCLTKLYFGEKDTFRPSESWFTEMKVPYTIIASEDHDLYKRIKLFNS